MKRKSKPARVAVKEEASPTESASGSASVEFPSELVAEGKEPVS